MKNEYLAESDWKHFRRITPGCRERYLGRINARLSAILSGEGTETERFWKVGEEFDKESKILVDCLDDHRRSNAALKAGMMFSRGFFEDEDLEGFTEEFVERIRPFSERWGK